MTLWFPLYWELLDSKIGLSNCTLGKITTFSQNNSAPKRCNGGELADLWMRTIQTIHQWCGSEASMIRMPCAECKTWLELRLPSHLHLVTTHAPCYRRGITHRDSTAFVFARSDQTCDLARRWWYSCSHPWCPSLGQKKNMISTCISVDKRFPLHTT